MSSSDPSDIFELKYQEDHLRELGVAFGIKEPRYRVESASEKGENFVGIVYRVIVWDDGRENEKLRFIFKGPPNSEIQRRYMQTAVMFESEIYFYTKVVPLFEKILKEHKKSLDFVPTCYRTSLREYEEIVILEDLAQRGFALRDRLDHFDYPHAATVLRYLGRLHALSFALRDQRPETMKILVKMRENVFNKYVLSNEVFRYRVDLTADSVRTALSDEESRYVERFNKFYKNVWSNVERACRPEAAEPYTVITHGDSWSNNILFKYKKDSREPEDVCFIDFQISRFASPAFDIHHVIYSCTNQELRDEYYDHLIRDYYDSFFEFLTELGSDPNTLFPFNVLREHLKKFGCFAGAVVIVLLHLITSNRDEVPEMNESMSDVKRLKERVITDRHYRVTLRDAFKDMIDRDYI